MNNKIHYKFNTNELHCKEAMQKIWNITLKLKKKWKMMKEFDERIWYYRCHESQWW
jgi:hypothetical protein